MNYFRLLVPGSMIEGGNNGRIGTSNFLLLVPVSSPPIVIDIM